MKTTELQCAQIGTSLKARRVLPFRRYPPDRFYPRLRSPVSNCVPIKGAIPIELSNIKQWVAWNYGIPKEKGKRSKLPINPETGRNASVIDSKTWGSFNEALHRCRTDNLAGVGFVFTEADPYVGIDLDDCCDPKTGILDELATRLLSVFDSYAEISPSGTGIKFIVRGKLPGNGIKTPHIEMYDCKRFFTITGRCIDQTHKDIKNKSNDIVELYKSLAPPKKEDTKISQQTISPMLSDDELIAKAMAAKNGNKFEKLMNGNTSEYNNDHSAADQALANILAFWSRGNPEQIDRIFRKSKLFRLKWDDVHTADGKTYGQATINKAISYSRNFYQPIQFTPAEIMKALEDGEQGDADIFIKIHRNCLCFDHASQRWFLWGGNYWVEDLKNEALASVMDVVGVYQNERDRLCKQKLESIDGSIASAKSYNDDFIKKLDERIAKLKSQPKREHILKLACAGKDSVGITGNEWDSKPWMIACPNGILSLKGEEVIFRKGSPDDYIKMVVPSEWQDIDTRAPLWKKTLKEIFQDDRKLIRHVRKLLGYALTGSCKEHIFIVFNGPGRNGKTTIIETIKYVLGALADAIPTETLLYRTHALSGGSPRADLMKLRGLRLAWASESGEGQRFNMGLLKQLSGGDTIVAREPFGKRMVSFNPTHTLFFLTNNMPHISVDDYAFWQRLHLIPFSVSFVNEPSEDHERKADTELLEKLKAEAPGILAWLVKGCLSWQRKELKKPSAVEKAIRHYRYEEDILGRFLEKCCTARRGKTVRATSLFMAYKSWCDDAEIQCWNQTKFGREMGKRFKKKTSNGIIYLGLALKKNKGLFL